MNTYSYKGMNKKGKAVQSSIEADSIANAKQMIKKSGIYLISIEDANKKQISTTLSFSRKRVSVKDFASMTRGLSTLLKSGVPLLESLDTIVLQTQNPVMKNILIQIRTSVNEGNSFFSSIQPYPKVFNSTYVAMCEAGEVSGTLDVVLLRLAEFTEAQSRIQNKVRSALIYPALMMSFSFFMIIFLMVYVVPKISVIFEDNESTQLPWYSTLMIDLSVVLQQYWLALAVGVLILIMAIWKFTQSQVGKAIWDKVSLKLPVLGDVLRSAAISRLSRTLSTLLHGGVPMIDSLNISKNVVNNSVIRQVIEDAKEAVQRGDNLSTPFIQSGEFPPMVTQMIRVGEKTGQLEMMLRQISDTYDSKIKSDVDTLTSLLEPVMLIVMGGIIAFIVFSTIIPLMQMYNTTAI